jgi:hypothetical protein
VVTFEQNIDECIALATIGLGTDPGTLARSDTVISATNRGQANDAAVTVTTWDAGDDVGRGRRRAQGQLVHARNVLLISTRIGNVSGART